MNSISKTTVVSREMARALLWLGLAILALGVFLEITKEIFEGKVAQLDGALLLEIATARTPWRTAVAMDVTALGSLRVLIWLTAAALVALLATHRRELGGRPRTRRLRTDILQLLTGSIGAGLLTDLTKGIIERPRPEVIPRLVAATGWSYPSGHSMGATAVYLTIASLIAGHLRRRWERITIFALAGAVAVLVALSRVYLGVHYPSDAASGVALGAAWACLVAGGFSAS